MWVGYRCTAVRDKCRGSKVLWLEIVIDGIAGVSGTESFPAIFTCLAVFELVAGIVAFPTMKPLGVFEWKTRCN